MEKKTFVDFKGKRILVTGASSGIGRAICIELSHYGANLILAGRNDERLKETAELLTSGDHKSILLDLNDTSNILPTVREFSQNHGRIFGLCHSAGIVETRPLSSSKAETFTSMINLNLISGLELCRTISRRDVLEETGGSFLFISSVDAHKGKPGQIAYSASKGAVNAAVRSMAVELARKKIRVNTLSPGLVKTPMTEKALSRLSDGQIKKLEEAFPLGIGAPEDVARAAVFLLAPQNSWITGTDFIIDGGHAIS